MKTKNILELINLQLFAEESDPTAQNEGEGTNTNEPTNEPNTDDPNAPKYTDADLDRIISRKMAEITKKAEKESKRKAEAERLASMNEQEKKEHELNELKKELEEMKKSQALSAMGKTARSILSEKNIHVSDALISNLISDDADSTKEAVESFATEFQSAVEKAVAEKLKGQAPKVKVGQTKTITKEEIMKVQNAKERQALILEHMDLFK